MCVRVCDCGPATVGGERQEQHNWKKYHLQPISDCRGFIILPDSENGSRSADILPQRLRHSHTTARVTALRVRVCVRGVALIL